MKEYFNKFKELYNTNKYVKYSVWGLAVLVVLAFLR